MAERIPQSVAYLVVFRAYLSSDGTTLATGKTIAITISKNGATSFSNPNVGALNATEMANGFYKFTLDTTDTGTLGPLAWRGTNVDINDAGDALSVVKSTNAGFSALPDAAPGAAGGVFIAGTNAATTITTSLTTTFTGNLTGSVASVSGNVGGNVVGSVGSATTVNGLANNVITTASINNGAITDAKFTLPTEATGTPSTFLQLIMWIAGMLGWRKVIKDSGGGTIVEYMADGTTVKTTSTYTSSGGVDTINKAS